MDKELETIAFSKGMQQGMIEGLRYIIAYCKKKKHQSLPDVINFCKEEIERIQKIDAIGKKDK